MRSAAIVALAVSALVTSHAAAQQCGSAVSECRTCHEVRGARPVLAGPLRWHVDHAFADLCPSCHGGDPSAARAADAHRGVVRPLDDVQGRCGPCHGAESDTLARRYRAQALAAGAQAPRPPSPPRARRPRGWPNVVLATLALVLGAGGLALVVRRERRLRGAAAPSAARNPLTRASWSPYAAGVLLGATTCVSMAVFGKRISGSGAYQSLSGYAGRALAPHAMYWRFVVPTGVTWEVKLALGMFVGAFLSAVLGGQFAVRTMPDRGWTEVFGKSVVVRWALVFFGTALLELASGIAGGCTAGLAVSGGAALAPGAFVFIAAMFAGGIPVARWLLRRRS